MISYHLRDIGGFRITVGYICYRGKEPCVNNMKGDRAGWWQWCNKAWRSWVWIYPRLCRLRTDRCTSSCHVERCRCFPLGASHQRVNLYAWSLFQMVMQKDTKIYPGSGKRRPYVQRRGERVCIILHLRACTGVNTSVAWSVELYYVWAWYILPFYSWVPPFIIPRRDPGYMYRRQNRSR